LQEEKCDSDRKRNLQSTILKIKPISRILCGEGQVKIKKAEVEKGL